LSDRTYKWFYAEDGYPQITVFLNGVEAKRVTKMFASTEPNDPVEGVLVVYREDALG
jgi:hypothetical protein